MIYRLYPVRDTFITNVPVDGVRQTGSNVGLLEELQVFKVAAISGAYGQIATGSLARSLLAFDVSRLSDVTASFTSAGESFYLRLAHKTSADTLPSSYDMDIHPIASGWDEGRGIDDSLIDRGCANWVKRTSTQFWGSQGGDFTAASCSFHFDQGNEDLLVDVTSIVNTWQAGTDNGLIVKMSPSVESETNFSDYYVKKFYSRHTAFLDRRPYLELRMDDFRGDDRANMQWDRTGSLYLYNSVDGVLEDIQGTPVIAKIKDGGNQITAVTASRESIGVYKATFALQSASYTGSVMYDMWSVGGRTLGTGSFSLSSPYVSFAPPSQPLRANVGNLADQYTTEDVVDLQVSFRRKPYRLPVVNTASLAQDALIVEKCYYAIENDATRERVVPFGTGSLQHTRLSYDANGNRFTFHMSNLHAGNAYKLLFLVVEGGKKTVIDQGLKFRVI